MGDKFTQFTLEEIYFIKTCSVNNKDETVHTFEKYLKYAGADMAETIRNTIQKMLKLSDVEFEELRNYPI